MTAPGPNNTLLVITPLSGADGLILTPYSARGLTQTLEPISGTMGGGHVLGTWIRESTNGELINLTYAPFKKYQSVISCRDQETPCLDNAWKGEIVQVDCAAELNYLTSSGSPNRPVVSGSDRTTDDGFTFYRPQLIMMVIDIRNSFAEYEAETQWSVDLREVSAP